jgi:hypothetical protein
MTLELFLVFSDFAGDGIKREITNSLYYLGLTKSGPNRWIAEGLDRNSIKSVFGFIHQKMFPAKHNAFSELSVIVF